jgi:hypothetical protein
MESDESTKDVVQEPLEGQLGKPKAWHAYQLKLAGLSLSEIADRLKYTSGGAVAKAIKDEMLRNAQDTEPETRETILDLEIARLDYMQARLWMGVEAGDPKAIESVLKIITLRARLRGLDQVDATKGQHTVLVVGGSEKEYVDGLKLVAGEG